MSHGNLAVPSGFVPGDVEADPEQIDGPDCVSEFLFEVLSTNVQGPVCNFLYVLGSRVIRYVFLFPY